jgi:hypothetical protein
MLSLYVPTQTAEPDFSSISRTLLIFSKLKKIENNHSVKTSSSTAKIKMTKNVRVLFIALNSAIVPFLKTKKREEGKNKFKFVFCSCNHPTDEEKRMTD